MANPIAQGFKGLARFSGRDRRKAFWPYAGVVIVLIYLLGGGLAAAAMAPIFEQTADYAAANPEHATVTSRPGHYSVSIDAAAPGAPDLMPDLTLFFGAMGLSILMAVVLLAAAVSRRLHDTGRSAYWGLAPVPFLISALVLMPMLMRDFSGETAPNLGLFLLLGLNNILYLAALVGLIALLCMPTKAGPNRFGDEPSSAAA